MQPTRFMLFQNVRVPLSRNVTLFQYWCPHTTTNSKQTYAMTEAAAASDALSLPSSTEKKKDERAAAADGDPTRAAITTTTTKPQAPPPKPPSQQTVLTPEQAAHRILILGSIHFLCTLANIVGALTHRHFLTGASNYWDNPTSGLIWIVGASFGLDAVRLLSQMSPVLASRVQVAFGGTGVFAALALAAGVEFNFLATWGTVAFWASFGLEAWLGIGTRGMERLVEMILRAARVPRVATSSSSSSLLS